MSACILPSNPDYQKLLANTPYTESTLNAIIKQYWKEKPDKGIEGKEVYPSEDYVKRFFETSTSETTAGNVIRVWRDKFRVPFEVHSAEDERAVRNAALQYFGESAILSYETKDKRRFVRVARPILRDESRTFEFNREQKYAIGRAADWLLDKKAGLTKDEWIVIEGEAGTGKTSIINDILLNAPDFYGESIMVGAVSNQATDNIIDKLSDTVLNNFSIDRKTVAGMLGLREDTSGEKKSFVEDPRRVKPLLDASAAIIDEASMITEQFIELTKQAARIGVPILFIGDEAQVRPIREGAWFEEHKVDEFADAPVFSNRGNTEFIALKERVRQGEDSPILSFAHDYREAWAHNTPLPRIQGRKSSADGRLIFTAKRATELLKDLVPVFQEAIRTNNPNLIHIVPYNRDYTYRYETELDERGNIVYTRSGKAKVKRVIDGIKPRSALWWNQKVYDALHPDHAGKYVLLEGDLVRFDDDFKLSENETIHNSDNAQVIESSEERTDVKGVKYRMVTINWKGRTITVPVVSQDLDNMRVFDNVVSELFKKAREREILYQDVHKYIDGYAKLVLSYALNVHRAQGSTYDITILDQDNIDTANIKKVNFKPVYKDVASLGYTAATRARNVLLVASTKADETDMRFDLLTINRTFNEARKNKPVEIKPAVTTPVATQLNTVPVAIVPDSNAIDIVSSSKEWGSLSNFAERPFTPGLLERDYNTGEYSAQPYPHHFLKEIFDGKRQFKTVEGAFQAAKLAYTGTYTSADKKVMADRFATLSGKDARSMGRSLNGLKTKEWDAVSSDIMYFLLRESFLQNDEATSKLLETAGKLLTHSIPDTGKSNFIGNLSKLRDVFIEENRIIPKLVSSPLANAVYETMKAVERQRINGAVQNAKAYELDKNVSAVEVLGKIVNGDLDIHATESQKKLAAALIPLAGRLNLTVRFVSGKHHYAGSTYKVRENNVDVLVAAENKKIKTFPTGTVIHEIVHALSTITLDKDATFDKAVGELREYVINYIKDNAFEGDLKKKQYTFYNIDAKMYSTHVLNFDIYGLSTNGEFLAEAFGNEGFQRMLKEIPAQKGKKMSVWDKIVAAVTNAFSRIFKSFHPTDKSVYDELMPVMSYALEAGSYGIDREKGTARSVDMDETKIREAAGILVTRSPEVFAGVQESQDILNSERTILSNEELKYWNEKGFSGMPRILVGSEHTDPAFHTKKIIDILEGRDTATQFLLVDKTVYDTLPENQRAKSVKNGITKYYKLVSDLSGKDFAGLYLITKHDGLPMLDLLQTKIPKLIHFSITTLGGTIYEPGVMNYRDLLDRIQDYIAQGLDPRSVTVRIDPIIPGVTNFADIEEVVRRASGMGIKRIRFSVMDAYENTVKAMSALGYDFEKYYGMNTAVAVPKVNFYAKQEYMDGIFDFMLSLKDKYGVTLGTCAEFTGRTGISKEGCLSVDAVNNMLGTTIADRGFDNNQQRKFCSCYGGKVDALAYNSVCASHCVYCYAKHENDKTLEYYNPDGTLKDNVFTRTRRVQQERDAVKEASPLADYTVHSGGARGSDTLWDEFAKKYGIKEKNIYHYYYEYKSEPLMNRPLTEEEYNEGVKKVWKANETLHRRPAGHMRFLARNWMQVKGADAVFAVGVVEGNIVSGGTGWAVQMAINEGKPVYVLDLLGSFMQWNYEHKRFETMKEPPVLTKNFAGIGTRDIDLADAEGKIHPVNRVVREMIAAVFDRTLLSLDPNKGTQTVEKPEGNIDRISRAYGLLEDNMTPLDKTKFTSSKLFLTVERMADNDAVEAVIKDIESGTLGIGTRIVPNHNETADALIQNVRILNKILARRDSFLSKAASIPIPIDRFDKEDLDRLDKAGIRNDGESIFIPAYSVGLSERELSNINKREKIAKTTFFNPVQIRTIGVKILWKTSDIITRLQTKGVTASQEFLAPYGEMANKDFTGKTRLEIINTVGINNLIDVATDALLPNNPEDTQRTRIKKQFIRENRDIIVEQAQDFLAKTEEIGLNANSVKRGLATTPLGGEIEEAFDVDSEIEIAELSGPTAEHWMIGFRQVSAVSSLSAIIRRTLSSFVELDPEGRPIQEEYGPKLLDTHQAVLDMLTWTSGVRNSDEMVRVLQAHMSTHPWLRQLVGEYYEDNTDGSPVRQGILLNPENGQLKSKFFSNMSRFFQTYITMYRDDDGQSRINIINQNGFTEQSINELRILDQNKYTDIGLTIWDKTGKLSDDFFRMRAIIGYPANSRDHMSATGLVAAGQENEVTRETLEKIQTVLSIMDIQTPSLDELAIVFQSPAQVAKFASVMGFVANNIQARAKKPDTFSLFNGSNTIESDLKKVLGMIEPVMSITSEAVAYEGGKLHYGYVQPSYLNKFVSKLAGKVADYDAFMRENFLNYTGWFYTPEGHPTLLGNGHLNFWIQQMNYRDANGNYIWRNLLKHVASLSFDKKPYSDKPAAMLAASYLQAYFYDEHAVSAYYRVILPSNKPTEEYIRFIRLSKNYKSIITRSAIEQIFMAEVNRIKTVAERIVKSQQGMLKKDALVAALETKTQNGLQFQFLRFLNEHREKGTPLGKLVDEILMADEAFRIEAGQHVNFVDTFRSEFQKYMSGRFNEFLDNMEAEGVITRDKGVITSVFGVQDLIGTHEKAMASLEEFFWNDWFAQANMMQIFMGDPAQYKNAEDIQKRAAQLHAPGMLFDLSAKDIKTGEPVSDGYERFMVIEDVITRSHIVDVLEKIHDKILTDPKYTVNGRLTELGKKKSASLALVRKAFEKTNVTDGQALISPTGLRKKMHGYGDWTQEMEDVYQRIITTGDITNKDLNVLWPVLKPFSYSQVAKNTGSNRFLPFYRLAVQQKDSEFTLVLVDALARSVDVDSIFSALYDVMEESSVMNGQPLSDGIDAILFDSTLKTGLSGALDFKGMTPDEVRSTLRERMNARGDVDINGEKRMYNPDYVYEIPFEDWTKQQEVPFHFEGTQQMGSQPRILMVADAADTHLDASGKPVDNTIQVNTGDGTVQTMTVKEAKERYFNLLAENIKDSTGDLIENLGLAKKNDKLRNIALSRLLTDELMKDGRYGPDMLRAISVDRNGEFITPLSDPMLAGTIQQMLNAIIKNRIYKQQIEGGPLVQVSSFGLSDSLNVVCDENTGRPLYAEVLISPPAEWYDIPEFLDEKGELSIDKINAVNPKILEMIGYRIPTEGKYSMLPFKVVGFMARSTEGIMLPAEITVLSGSDFDVDKLYIMRRVFRKNKDGRYTFEVSDRRERNNNDMLDIAWAFLTSDLCADQTLSAGNFDEEKKVAYTIAAVDNLNEKDSAKIARFVQEQAGKTSDELKDLAYKPYDLLFADTQIKFFKQNMVAAKLIGIFAQANVSHAFVALGANQGKPAFIKVGDGLKMTLKDVNGVTHELSDEIRIDSEYDWSGMKRISATFAELIGASVDSVKDPVFNLMNVNMQTANILATMVRIGWDIDSIAWFLTTPVIKELVKRHGLASVDNNVSIGSVIAEMQAEVLDGKPDKFLESYAWSKQDFVDMHNLEVVAQRREGETDDEFDRRKVQQGHENWQLLELFARMLGVSDTMRSIVHMTRMNSIASAPGPYAANAIVDMLKSGQFDKNPALEGVKDIINGNPLLRTFRLSSEWLFRKILGENLVQAGPFAREVYNVVENYYGYISDDIAQKMSEFMMSYMVNWKNPVFDLSRSNRRYMLMGFPNLFLTMRNRYPDNIFLKSIVHKKSNDKPYLELKTRGLKEEEIQNYKAAWDKLYKDEAKRLSSLGENIAAHEDENLAIKLVEYNFFRGGLGFDPKTFMKLVPESIKDVLPNYRENTRSLESIDMGSFDSNFFDNMLIQFMLNTGLLNMRSQESLAIQKDKMTGKLYVTEQEGNEKGLKNMGVVAVGKKVKNYFAVHYHPQAGLFELTPVHKLGGDGFGFEIDPNIPAAQLDSVFDTQRQAASQETPEAVTNDYVEPYRNLGGTHETSTTTLKLMAQVLGADWNKSGRPFNESFKTMSDTFFSLWESQSVENITKNDNFVLDQLKTIDWNLSSEEVNEMIARVTKNLDEQNICR